MHTTKFLYFTFGYFRRYWRQQAKKIFYISYIYRYQYLENAMVNFENKYTLLTVTMLTNHPINCIEFWGQLFEIDQKSWILYGINPLLPWTYELTGTNQSRSSPLSWSQFYGIVKACSQKFLIHYSSPQDQMSPQNLNDISANWHYRWKENFN